MIYLQVFLNITKTNFTKIISLNSIYHSSDIIYGNDYKIQK